jgi:hypothetical protein
MKIRICSTCGKDETEVPFYKTGNYCKYCKTVIETKRRFLEGCEKHKDDINQLYKYQRFFLYNLHIKRNRSLEMCSEIMGFHVEELKLGLFEMGYYQDDPCWCSNCARFKPRTEFKTASNRKSGHQDWCNECKEIYNQENKEYIQKYKIQYHLDHRDEHLEYARNYYQENKEHLNQVQKEYHLKHRDEHLEYAREYYLKNKDHLDKLQKEYYLENIDTIKQKQKEYYQENREDKIQKQKEYYQENKESRNEYRYKHYLENKSVYLSYSAKRRAAVLQAIPKWVNLNEIKAIYEEADRLQKLDGIPRHVDHIIPLQHELVCGLHVENNLQILTAEENQRKSNKFEPIIESLVK